MTDRQFLMWIHERLMNVYGESELVGHMHRLRAIIAATPNAQTSKGIGDEWGHNSLLELKADLAHKENYGLPKQ